MSPRPTGFRFSVRSPRPKSSEVFLLGRGLAAAHTKRRGRAPAARRGAGPPGGNVVVGAVSAVCPRPGGPPPTPSRRARGRPRRWRRRALAPRPEGGVPGDEAGGALVAPAPDGGVGPGAPGGLGGRRAGGEVPGGPGRGAPGGGVARLGCAAPRHLLAARVPRVCSVK